MSQPTPPTASVPATPPPASLGNGASDTAPIAVKSSPPESHPRLPYWLQQAERFLRVIVRIYLGLLVCFAPWYPPAWDNNPLFMSSTTLMGWITSGAVRGMVSGLGLLNLWIALRDAIRAPNNPGQG